MGDLECLARRLIRSHGDRRRELREALAAECLPIVRAAARRMPPTDRDEAESRGTLALAKAIDRYRPQNGDSSFELYLRQRICWRLKELRRRRSARPAREQPLSYDVGVTPPLPTDWGEIVRGVTRCSGRANAAALLWWARIGAVAAARKLHVSRSTILARRRAAIAAIRGHPARARILSALTRQDRSALIYFLSESLED